MILHIFVKRDIIRSEAQKNAMRGQGAATPCPLQHGDGTSISQRKPRNCRYYYTSLSTFCTGGIEIFAVVLVIRCEWNGTSVRSDFLLPPVMSGESCNHFPATDPVIINPQPCGTTKAGVKGVLFLRSGRGTESFACRGTNGHIICNANLIISENNSAPYAMGRYFNIIQ